MTWQIIQSSESEQSARAEAPPLSSACRARNWPFLRILTPDCIQHRKPQIAQASCSLKSIP